ncbi:hypothetical protein ACT3CD_02265 [Geofilum sp. OHC36d9]|uniref:hypothetical protein n=1 Tax=Geofilum sp. OHC36d9 TaxID=3458413 RepID=UPI004033627E
MGSYANLKNEIYLNSTAMFGPPLQTYKTSRFEVEGHLHIDKRPFFEVEGIFFMCTLLDARGVLMFAVNYWAQTSDLKEVEEMNQKRIGW